MILRFYYFHAFFVSVSWWKAAKEHVHVTWRYEDMIEVCLLLGCIAVLREIQILATMTNSMVKCLLTSLTVISAASIVESQRYQCCFSWFLNHQFHFSLLSHVFHSSQSTANHRSFFWTTCNLSVVCYRSARSSFLIPDFYIYWYWRLILNWEWTWPFLTCLSPAMLRYHPYYHFTILRFHAPSYLMIPIR